MSLERDCSRMISKDDRPPDAIRTGHRTCTDSSAQSSSPISPKCFRSLHAVQVGRPAKAFRAIVAPNHAKSQSVATSEAIEFVDGSIYAHPERRLLSTLQEREHCWLAGGKAWPAVTVETAQELD